MAVVGLLVLVGSFMVGLVALAVVAGLGLLGGLVFWARVAWIRRQLRKQQAAGDDARRRYPEHSTQSEYIETEYTVVSRRPESRDADL